MLFKSKPTSVKLAKKFQKMLFLSNALKNTFVFLAMPRLGSESLVHCDSLGKILFEHTFANPVDSLALLSDREAMVLDTRNNCISALDLETHSFTHHPHQFAREESDLAEMETFYESRLLCVKESGQYNDNRFFLTYYSYPLGSKPVARYESEDNEWTHEYISRKANSHSMMCWFKPRNDEEIEIKTFDLRDDPKGAYRRWVVRNTAGVPYGLDRFEMAINTMWEVRRGQFMLVCISNKTENNSLNKDGVINNNYVVDVTAETIREASFSFNKDFNDYQIDQLYLGPISMFRTFCFFDGKVQPSPVYYVNNETEKIVATEEWQCTYRTKYFVPGYDSCLLLEGEFENGDVEEFTLWTKKVLDPR